MRFLLFPIVLLITACAAPVIDYQAGTDFSRYDSAGFEPIEGDAIKSLDASRIETALRTYLPASGLKVLAENADITVLYGLAQYSQFDSNEVIWGFGASRSNVGVGFSVPVSSREVRKLRLDIEFVDAQTNRVVWKARSAAYLDEDAGTSTREKWIDRQTQKMLQAYPPAP